ncbi:MAG: 4-hydroxybenzoate octaprenyltransferase [Xanthomonadales bacterium]|nr:4-hydroxybenzoate octaprenyltransferase [Xanthomonadales bacterium]
MEMRTNLNHKSDPRSILSSWWRLMRFDKPIGILLLLWPTLWALWIAGDGEPNLKNLIIFALGVTLTRAGGCIINDYADRDFDGHVERTSGRPLATGKIRPRHALFGFVVLMLLAFGLVLLTNALTIKLAFVALALAASYPFFKRFTHLPQFVLGLAFSWGIIMAFAAEQNQIPAVAWWLLAANLVWTVYYDTLYAMVDREDDLKIGVKSTAILFGRFDLLILSVLVVVFLGVLVQVGILIGAGVLYYSGLVIAGLLMLRQLTRCRSRKAAGYFWAFLNNNYVGLVVFAGIVGSYLMHAR